MFQCVIAHHRFGGRRGPIGRSARRRGSKAARCARPPLAMISRARSSRPSGRAANRKPAPSRSSTSVLARSLRPAIAAANFARAPVLASSTSRSDLGTAGQIGQAVKQRVEQLVVRHRAHEMAVHILELDEIEARRRTADRRKIKSLDHLLSREEFLVAVAPTEPQEIVAQGVRQIAHRAIGVDAERAMALRKLGAVRPMDQRNMRHDRRLPTERLIDLQLTRGVGQMVVAANDLRDAHVVIVDDDGEHIGRRSIRAQKDKIVEVLVGEGDAALYFVVDDSLALLLGAQTYDRLDAGRRLGRIAVAPAPVVAHRPTLGAGPLAHFAQLVGAGVTAIGAAGGEQALHDFAMALDPAELADRLAVPFKAEPGEAVDDRFHGLVRRALAVGVFDAQQKRSAVTTRIEPVEQGGSRPADMQKARWRGRETRHYLIVMGDRFHGSFRSAEQGERG